MAPVCVLGASGFVGSSLTPVLSAAGHDVRCATRNVAKNAAAEPKRTWVHADVNDRRSLDAAFAGCDVVVYLVHQMRTKTSDLVALERRSAKSVAAALARSTTHRLPRRTWDQGHHPHLEARNLTGKVLRESGVPTTELKAHGCRIRLRVGSCPRPRRTSPYMVLPSWLKTTSSPVSIDDVVHALSACVDRRPEQSECYQVSGPDN